MDARELFLSPTPIGHRIAANRLVAQPMETNTAHEDGSPSWATIERYRTLTSGGWGMVCIECTSVLEEDRPVRRQTALTPGTADAFASMVGEMRSAHPEPLIFIQLSHNGRHIEADTGRRCSPAPTNDPDCRLMTRDEILWVRDATIRSACVAAQAGFDGVDIKQCHMFFGAEIISPRNTRGDEYGGSFENRSRFFREVIEGIRAEAPELLLLSRLSIYEDGPGEFGTAGLGDPTPDLIEPRLLLHLLGDLGVHIASVTGPPLPGWPDEHSIRPSREEELYRALRLPGIVKRELEGTDVLTLNTGNSAMGADWPYAARFCLENRLTDLVGFGKQSMADPLLPIKLASGEAIDACQLHMGCVRHFTEAEPVQCDIYGV